MDYRTINNKVDVATLQFCDGIGRFNRIKLNSGDKIRVVFLFQAASFWPSWESVWQLISTDDRFDAKMILCDLEFKEKTQFKTAGDFLTNNNIPYEHIDQFSIEEFNPHIIFVHTPYDGHRPRSLHARNLAVKGYRLIYIPYGIEISDIEKARGDHFHGGVTNLAWRIYSFSPQIVPYYKMFAVTNGDMVRGFGHPKFDIYKSTSRPAMPDDIKKAARGRPVVLVKVHFPKKVRGKYITPSVNIYKELFTRISEYNGIFCVFMPHPKFYEQLARYEDAAAFEKLIKDTENVIQYDGDDYRPVLLNVDYHIVDRSALMIEAGVTGKPVLFVEAVPEEKLTIPVERIVSTFYKAKNAVGIFKFLDTVVLMGEDPLKQTREEAIAGVIPNHEQSAATMIVEDIVTSISNENDTPAIKDKMLDKIVKVTNEFVKNDFLHEDKVNFATMRIKNHLSYRLGWEMVKTISHPSTIFSLPRRMWKTYRRYKKGSPFDVAQETAAAATTAAMSTKKSGGQAS